jgi:hypothetical protein
MEFQGSKQYYKKLLFLGIVIAFLAFFIGSVTQRDEFHFFNAFLFALGGGAAGGFIGVPLVYMSQPIKKIVLTDKEVQLHESKKIKVAKLNEIRNVKLMRNGILIQLTKGKLLISKMHGYPIQDVYEQLSKKLSA